ncbi:MAG: hypothetical protein ABI824_08455, partial [Acidobacteriota bacterium]
MRTFLICGIAILLVGSLYAQPQAKPIKRPKNNELAIEGPVPGTGREAETPAAVSAAVDRLMFHVSPLQTQGLLSEQLREALKFLIKANGNATFVKLRAFVAGTGDLRRVPAIVAEMFAEKKLALPAVTTVRVGGFGLDNAQVVIESVSEAKKPGANGAVKFLYGNEAATGTEAVARLEDAMNRTLGSAMLLL